jgi:hypothetical protein
MLSFHIFLLFFVSATQVPEHLNEFSNGVLVAVASGLSGDETDASIKLAAVQALHNALHFVKKNMEIEVCVSE